MFKLVVISMIIAYASAGLIGGGYGGYGHGGLVVAQPALAVAHAPIAVKAGATSYQNSNSLSIHPVPVVAHAPVAVAHAPVAVAHAPVAVAHVGAVGLGGLGGLGGYGGYGGIGLGHGYGGIGLGHGLIH